MEAVETPHQKAIRLLNQQLHELQFVRARNSPNDPRFKVWRDTTRGYLDRFLGKQNHHISRFANTRFSSLNIYATQDDELREFQIGCMTAEETLKAAIREVEDFGIYEEQTKPTTNRENKSGGVNQNFHGPVNIHNLAIAADNAIQKIGQMGDKTGVSLKEIAALLHQSEELSPRQVKQGLADIQAMAVEVEKPEAKRDWKSILELGNAILELTTKATDLTQKMWPYTAAILTWIEQAKHYVK